MVLAEALLRVPDATTADRLIEDKLAAGDWSSREVKSNALLVSASAWTLGMTARIINPGETPDSILDGLIRRLGIPAVRAATRQAMRLLGSHFVLGQTIEEALQRAARHPGRRYSYDMLGEGARTADDADRYFASYARAIDEIGASAGDGCTAGPAGHFGQAVGAQSAVRGGFARPGDGRAGAAGARTRPPGAPVRPQLHHRRRRGRPAGTEAGRDRGGAARPLAARLGRLRSRGPGVPEALAGGDRLARRIGAGLRPATDGAARQGRLLGHRGQAGARARTGGLSGLHPQADDRSLLHGLQPQAARRPPRALSAVRHPQCAHGRGRDRGRRRRQRLRIPAAARHGPDALRIAARRTAGCRRAGLCAGRRPPRPAGLPGATAVGERRELLVRVGGGRSVGAGRRPAQAPAGLDRRRAARPPSENPAAARPLCAVAPQLAGRRVR